MALFGQEEDYRGYGALQADLAARDIPMLQPEPVKGAGDFLCNFVSPIATRGVLVEYVQPL